MNKKLFILFLFYNTLYIYADFFYFNFNPDRKYNLTIKANYKIYKNKKYIGLYSKEIKSILHINSYNNNKFNISTEIYKIDKISRNGFNHGFNVEKNFSSNFKLTKYGEIENKSTKDFPVIEGVPYFINKEININDVYYNKGYAFFEDNLDNSHDLLPIDIYTKYIGKKELFSNIYEYFEITYSYSKNFISKVVEKALGLHKIKFYFDSNNGIPVYLEDHFEEEFTLKNSNILKKSGFYLYFYKIIENMNKNEIIQEINNIINDEENKNKDDKVTKNNNIPQLNNNKDFTIEEKKEGISITLNNLNFKANSTELLENEYSKIEKIYNILKNITNRTFLIKGHTASTGKPQEEYELSLSRAKTIANLLIEKGINREKIMIIGKGGTEPIAPNDTEENMKKNRRVEIIILED